jgi:hypothetical protein
MPDETIVSVESIVSIAGPAISGTVTSAAATHLLMAPQQLGTPQPGILQLVEHNLVSAHSTAPAVNPAILFGPPREGSLVRSMWPYADRTHKFPVRSTHSARIAPVRLACENEDANITGLTRSLHRRILALHLPNPTSQPLSPMQPPAVAPLPPTAITLPTRVTAAHSSRRTA